MVQPDRVQTNHRPVTYQAITTSDWLCNCPVQSLVVQSGLLRIRPSRYTTGDRLCNRPGWVSVQNNYIPLITRICALTINHIPSMSNQPVGNEHMPLKLVALANNVYWVALCWLSVLIWALVKDSSGPYV